MMKTVNLREATFEPGSNPKFDLEKGELYDALIWGQVSKNGYAYPEKTLKEAVNLSNNSIVFIDHEDDEKLKHKTRATDGFGVVRDTYIDNKGQMRAKLFKWNTEHAFHESFKFWLTTAPDKIGFSVNARGDVEYNATTKQVQVSKINKVNSFDIVFNPATTGNILESENMEPTLNDHFGQLAAKIVADTSMDVAAKKAKLMQLLKLLDDSAGTQTAVDPAPEAVEEKAEDETVLQEAVKFNKNPLVKKLLSIVNKGQTAVAALQGEVSTFKKKEIENVRLTEAKKHLPDEAFNVIFTNALLSAKDDAEVTTIIETQKKLLESVGAIKKAPVSSTPDVSLKESQGQSKQPEKYDPKKISEIAATW